MAATDPNTAPDPTAAALLARLVAFDTVSARSNLALIDWVAAYLRGCGVNPIVLPNAERTKANLYATIGPKVPGGIVLSGHTDVVPVAGQAWDSDPFTLIERDGRLYGRGTADMKGFIAIALALVPALCRRRLAVPVHLALSYDEEIGCLGVPHLVRHVIDSLPRPRLVLVGEPTMLRMVNAHKSIAGFRTTVTGREAHSATPQHGANAILYAAEIIDFIGRLAAEARQNPVAGCGFDPPHATFNIGTVEGGSAINIVPRRCTLVWDYRALPGEDTDAVLARYHRFIEADILPRLCAGAPQGEVDTLTLCNVPALHPDPDGPAESLARRLTGANSAGTVAFASEAGVFQQAGIPAVVIGPGDVAQAHQPNEFISRDQLAAGEALLRRLADLMAA